MSPVKKAARRGAVTLWTILSLPLVVTMLVVVAEVNHLWQARVQLENALEAAALSAVKEWGDREGGAKNVAPARAAGVAYAAANPIHGVDDAWPETSAAWWFGRATPRGTGFDFRPTPEATEGLAVVLEATVGVARLCRPVVGSSMGVSTVSAKVAAYYDASTTPHQPRLIRLN